MKSDYLLIPVELCKLALSNRKVKEAALYIYLKSLTSGHFLINKVLVKSVCHNLGYKSQKTFNKHLKWLVKSEWITVNSKSKSHRIISFYQLARKYHFVSCLYGEFKTSEIKRISGFFPAVIITYCIKQINATRGKGQSDYSKHGITDNTDILKSRKYCPYSFVPITYMAKFLNVPRSTANRFKQKAISEGYITAENKLYPTIQPLIKNLTFRFYKNLGTEETKTFRKFAGKMIWEQMPDKIVSNILLKKKMKPLIKHVKKYL